MACERVRAHVSQVLRRRKFVASGHVPLGAQSRWAQLARTTHKVRRTQNIPHRPNHEHGHYDDDEDIDEEAPTGDTDIAAT